MKILQCGAVFIHFRMVIRCNAKLDLSQSHPDLELHMCLDFEFSPAGLIPALQKFGQHVESLCKPASFWHGTSKVAAQWGMFQIDAPRDLPIDVVRSTHFTKNVLKA